MDLLCIGLHDCKAALRFTGSYLGRLLVPYNLIAEQHILFHDPEITHPSLSDCASTRQLEMDCRRGRVAWEDIQFPTCAASAMFSPGQLRPEDKRTFGKPRPPASHFHAYLPRQLCTNPVSDLREYWNTMTKS